MATKGQPNIQDTFTKKKKPEMKHQTSIVTGIQMLKVKNEYTFYPGYITVITIPA